MALRYLNDKWDVNLSLDSSVYTGLDGLPGVLRGCNCYEITSEVQFEGRSENTGGILNIEYGGENYTFTSITSARNLSSKLPFDFDGTDFFINNTHDLQTEQDIFLQDQRIERDGWAAFAHGKLRFGANNDWEFSAGLRVSDEEATSVHALGFTSAFAPPFDNFLDVDVPKTLSSTAVTPSVSLSYSLGDSSNVYVTWSEGFKAGGFPKAAAGADTNQSFDDETSTNIELGYKTVAFNNRLALDFSIFTIDIEDQQLSSITFLNGDPNVPIATVANAGNSTSSGFDLSLTGLVTEKFEVAVGIGYTDTEYDIYVDADGDDRAGEQFPFVPEVTQHITGKYTTPVSSNADLALRASYRYVDNITSGAGVNIDVAYDIPSWNRLDLDAKLIWDTWDLTLYVNNVTDEYIETRSFNSFFFSTNPFFTPAEGLPHSTVEAPRVVGLRVIKSF